MPKIKMMPDPMGEPKPGIPPMPGPDGAEVSSSPSISSGPESPEPAVSEALAGDLIALPFDAAHLIWDASDPLSEAEKERLAGPFSRILEKYGLGKIAKDEILLGFYLTACIYGRVKAVHEAKKREALASNNSRETREG